MKQQLIMLGTGSAMVTKCYNTCYAIRIEEEYLLVDAGGGNGIFVQLEEAHIPYTNIHHMFLTHGHTDHILGAIWMIRKIAALMEQGKYEGKFSIYCHDEVAHMLHTFCDMTLTSKLLQYIGQRIQIEIVENGETRQTKYLQLQFFDIFSTKAKQFGVRVVLPDGQNIAILGDEPYNPKCQSYVKDSDWLLSEAFCLYEHREQFKPYEKNHSTALDAGKLASELNVKNLLLYHTEDTYLSTRKDTYTKEAKQYFKGNVYVPDDLEVITL